MQQGKFSSFSSLAAFVIIIVLTIWICGYVLTSIHQSRLDNQQIESSDSLSTEIVKKSQVSDNAD